MGIIEQVLELREQKGLKKGRQEGLKKGRQERDIIFVKNLLRTTDFSDERIAEVADVSIEFVKEMRSTL